MRHIQVNARKLLWRRLFGTGEWLPQGVDAGGRNNIGFSF
jgi:hypothetical protein